jgi:serine/threonine protein kinase
MAVAEAHPSVEELAAFTLGTLGDEAQTSIEAHVAACTSCQERAAAAPGDALVELLRSVHARTSRGGDTFAETAAQVQTPGPLVTLALTDAFASALAVSAPTETNRPGVPEALPPELARHERYRVVRLLGAGGMGAVYEAEHRVMQRPVALKVIKRVYTASAAMLERFRREVRAAARLSHPNIVTTYDAEDAGETHFLVMEYVEGTDLGRLVLGHGPLPVDRACDYVRQAALGLQQAFKQAMVHRDLKPHNLMLTPGGVVKVLDFGLARFAQESQPAALPPQPPAAAPAAAAEPLTHDGAVMGTPDYIAPEQAANAHQADIRSDIYSLGCTLYHLLAGQPPFPTGTPLQKVMAHAEKNPQPLAELRPSLPEGIIPVLERMMAKDPTRRYQTPAEVATALEPFAFSTAVMAKNLWHRYQTPAEGAIALEPLTYPTEVGRKGKPRPSALNAGRSLSLAIERSPAYHRSGRRKVALAAALLFVAGLLGTAVYRIATDQGELVITTESDDVKVVITQGGKLVDIIDTETDKQIRLALRSGEYELKLQGAAAGLKLNIDKATLTRGKETLATITRERPKPVASKYLILPIDKVASAVSTKSLFTGAYFERLIFPTWGKQEVFGIPFDVIDPEGDSVKNAIVLYGPVDQRTREMPKHIRLKCGIATKAIHLLGGVAGWGYRRGDNRKKTVCVIARLHHRDGETEDHELLNGVHFCDFVANESNYYDAPGSRLAMRLLDPAANRLTHIRYLAIQPWNPTKVIEEIEFIKAMNDDTSPVIMAVTIERSVSTPAEGKKANGGEIRHFGANGHRVRRVALSPDGQRLLTAGSDGFARYWDIATGKEIHRLPSNYGAVYDVAISPNVTKLLSCGIDSLIHVWDAATGEEVKKLTGHKGQIDGMAVSPDGRMVASSAYDCHLRLWNLDTGKLTASPGSREWGQGRGTTFSPDGKLIATWGTDRMVRLWDVKQIIALRGHVGPIHDNQKEVRCLEGHTNWVMAGAFSRDSSRLLTGRWPSDGHGPVREPSELILWEVTSGMEFPTKSGHGVKV